jgi:hypothetical protein
MRTYLFDAPAAVELYLPGDRDVKRVVSFICEQKTRFQEAMLYIPSLCIAEVFNTLARKYFRPTGDDDRLTDASYGECLRGFREDVHWGRTFYPYEFHRYHIVAAYRIIPIEHHFALKDEKRHLSTYDILVVAMACELAYTGIREDTRLVTCDKRMKDVVDKFRAVDLNDLAGKTPLGPLGEVEKGRWVPPECIDARRIRPGDLERVEGQDPIHLSSRT